jgi:hypothetical protein
MARTKQSTGAKFRGYVPVYLDEKSKKAVRANIPTPEQVLSRVEQFIEDEYRFNVQYSDYHECISVSLYDNSTRRNTSGYVLAAQHSEFLVAFAALVYLHEKVYADGWDIERSGKQDDVSW